MTREESDMMVDECNFLSQVCMTVDKNGVFWKLTVHDCCIVNTIYALNVDNFLQELLKRTSLFV
jgi:hypothetical protein